MSGLPDALRAQLRGSRTAFDLTDPAHQTSVVALAEAILGDAPDFGATTDPDLADLPLEARMALLLAESRSWMRQNTRPLQIGIVFAMWGEHNRLRARSPENPNGENALLTKVRQLDWVTAGTEVRWHLYAVDDGCPHGSADIAEELVRTHGVEEQVSVLRLASALPASEGPLRKLASADHSRKAGAVIFGCDRAIADGADAVIYTDADNSVHLGQIGLLLRAFVDHGARAVLGSRKHPGSVVVKEAARWGIGIKTLRHMQRMIGREIFSRGILDTQAAFKLYERELLREIIADPTVYDFSFDTDWILATLRRSVEIEQVPFAFIDSAAESASITQGPMTTWQTLLFGLAKAVRRHGYCTGVAEEMTRVLEEEIRDHRDLEKLIDVLPPELEEVGESGYGDPGRMSVEATRAWVREACAQRMK